jgi:phosphoglycerate dehydrogenase-like enzyme
MLAGNHWGGKADLLSQKLAESYDVCYWKFSDGPDAFSANIAEADVLLVSPDVSVAGAAILPLLRQSNRLKLIQIPFAGYDWLTVDLVPGGCQVANVHDHSSAIAEYVLAGMLEMAIGLRKINKSFREEGSWSLGGAVGTGQKHGELRGKRLGIFGYGHIGQDIAVRANAFGMQCCAVGSKPRAEVPQHLDWFGGPESFDRLLSESDYVVVSASLNDATRGKFDSAAFEKMKEGSVIINVGRGAIVNPEALFSALQRGRLAGAVLDVWYHYPNAENPQPRPADQPFQTLPNVIMTPHCASWTHGQDARRVESVSENIARFARGTPVENVVITGRAS